MNVAADDFRASMAEAERRADSRRRSQIDSLWSAKADPGAARALLLTLRSEFDSATARMQAALRPGWWDEASPEAILAVYEDARVWHEADADSEELARLFTAELNGRLSRLPRAA